MNMKTITTHEAKNQLSKYLKQIKREGPIVIYRGDVPVARLSPFHSKRLKKKRPDVGTVTSGKLSYDEDAFASLCVCELRDWSL